MKFPRLIGAPVIERIMLRVSIDPKTNCWVWQSRLNKGGYGTLTVGNKTRNAHCWAYEALVGAIPSGADLDHLCRNRACCNPAHLEPVTRSENLRRGIIGASNRARRKAITHCPKGHPYEGANLYVARDGHRDCNQCQRQRVRDWRARQAAKKSNLPHGVNYG